MTQLDPQEEKLFDEKFPSLSLQATDDTGGYDATPYVKQFIAESNERAEVKMATQIYTLLSIHMIHSNPDLADKAMQRLIDYLMPFVTKRVTTSKEEK